MPNTAKSPSFDGKRSYRCDACQLEMGPVRSRFKLWALTLSARALAAAIPLANIYLERPAIYTAAPLFAAFAMAGFREIRKPQPLKIDGIEGDC